MCQSHDYNTADTGDRLSRATVPVHWSWTTHKRCAENHCNYSWNTKHQINQLTNCHTHLPWKFHENRSSRFLVILLTKKQRTKKERKKQTNKQIDWKQYSVPRSIGDVVTRTIFVAIGGPLGCTELCRLYKKKQSGQRVNPITVIPYAHAIDFLN